MRITKNFLTFPIYIPQIVKIFKNWQFYLYNYLSRRVKPAKYYFRNGLIVVDGVGTLAGTIAVVFIRKEYGNIDRFQTIVDIGANMGTFALYAACSSKNAKIYCYEPEEKNYKFLKRNIEINYLCNRILPFNKAVSSKNGQCFLSLLESPLHSIETKKKVRGVQAVECVTFGNICEELSLNRVDLLKLNCEGSEYEILESFTSKDVNIVENIRLEYHNIDRFKRNGEYLLRLLNQKGFKIKRFTKYGIESGFIWATREVKKSIYK
jgi:FkbM family methyltransferase